MEFEIWQFGVFFAAGLIGGFIDAIAGGGGLICLPALMAMGVPPHAALATNKLQGSFGTFTATMNFAKKGFINFKELFVGIVCTFIGACIGTVLILFIDAKFLKFLIPVLLLAIFIYTIFSPKLGEEDRQAKLSSKTFYLLFGLGLGFYDGFFGPGTGSFWTFALVGFLGLGMKKAVAQTKAFNFVSNIVSLAVFIVGGQILWLVGLLMAVGQIVGGYLGSNMVIKKDVKFIKTMFLTMVGLTILKLIYDFI
ncbi:TSUP family transporter [Campylobacter geochelonis]|uniref:Probable membrane transporter protein n=1 Tax=Campylobacter geochelonis TaxID=1780362 RepID=A0A128EKN0_9BACT|nr:TSUP family transporter [Campylobacter geochelonis]QKF71129.1 sulfite exporter TauE/SafE family protein [Campylobacter geochelonis]CZE48273.1 inner membrane protein YfcA [Campylobacter geochelonis]CZE48952.1 inner membrane protein YfcA [Campylobacter geochelonis]CZE50049.1 inner membrane protein YfcA [Campylobacter geochelonis]